MLLLLLVLVIHESYTRITIHFTGFRMELFGRTSRQLGNQILKKKIRLGSRKIVIAMQGYVGCYFFGWYAQVLFDTYYFDEDSRVSTNAILKKTKQTAGCRCICAYIY